MFDIAPYQLMEESIDDVRFGPINIYYDPANVEDVIFCVRGQSTTKEDYLTKLKLAQGRFQLSSPYVLKMLGIEPDENFLIIKTFFTYPNNDYLSRVTQLRENQDELLQFIHDILSATAYLEKNKMIHGDIRPEYIYYDHKLSKYVLIDRLNDHGEAIETQENNILHGKLLFMSPKIFQDLLENNLPVSHNPYKSESFSVGLSILNVFVDFQKWQYIYNFEQRQINELLLEEIFDEMKAKFFADIDSKMIAEFIWDCLLAIDETARLTPRKALSIFRETLWKMYYRNPSLISKSKTSDAEEHSLVMTINSANSRRGRKNLEVQSSQSIQKDIIQIVDEANFISNKEKSGHEIRTEDDPGFGYISKNSRSKRGSNLQVSQPAAVVSLNERSSIENSFEKSNKFDLSNSSKKGNAPQNFYFRDSFGQAPPPKINSNFVSDKTDKHNQSDLLVTFEHNKTIKKQFPKFESNNNSQSGTNLNKSALNDDDDWENPQSHTEFEVFRISEGNEVINWDEQTGLVDNFSLRSKEMVKAVEVLKAYDKDGDDEIDFLQSQKQDEKTSQRQSLFNRNKPLLEKMNSNNPYDHGKGFLKEHYQSAEQCTSERVIDHNPLIDTNNNLRISAPFPNQKQVFNFKMHAFTSNEYDLNSPMNPFSRMNSNFIAPSELSPQKSIRTNTDFEFYSEVPDTPEISYTPTYFMVPVEDLGQQIAMPKLNTMDPSAKRQSAKKLAKRNTSKIISNLKANYDQQKISFESFRLNDSSQIPKRIQELPKVHPQPSPELTPQTKQRLANSNFTKILSSVSNQFKQAQVQAPTQSPAQENQISSIRDSGKFTYTYSEYSRMETGNSANIPRVFKKNTFTTPVNNSIDNMQSQIPETLWNVTVVEGGQTSILPSANKFPDNSLINQWDRTDSIPFKLMGIKGSQNFSNQLDDLNGRFAESDRQFDMSDPIDKFKSILEAINNAQTKQIQDGSSNFKIDQNLHPSEANSFHNEFLPSYNPSNNNLQTSTGELSSDGSSMFWHNIPITLPGMSQMTNGTIDEKAEFGEPSELHSQQSENSDLMARVDKQIKRSEEYLRHNSINKLGSMTAFRLSDKNLELTKNDSQRLSLNRISKSPSKFKMINPEQAFESSDTLHRSISKGQIDKLHTIRKSQDKSHFEANTEMKANDSIEKNASILQISNPNLMRLSVNEIQSEPIPQDLKEKEGEMPNSRPSPANEKQSTGPPANSQDTKTESFKSNSVKKESNRPSLYQQSSITHPKKRASDNPAIQTHPQKRESDNPVTQKVFRILQSVTSRPYNPQFFNAYIVNKPYEIRNLSPTPDKQPSVRQLASHGPNRYVSHQVSVQNSLTSQKRSSRSPLNGHSLFNDPNISLMSHDKSAVWINAKPLEKSSGSINPIPNNQQFRIPVDNRFQPPLQVTKAISPNPKLYYSKPHTAPVKGQFIPVKPNIGETHPISKSPVRTAVANSFEQPVQVEVSNPRIVIQPFQSTYVHGSYGEFQKPPTLISSQSREMLSGAFKKIDAQPVIVQTKIVNGRELCLVRNKDGSLSYRYKQDLQHLAEP